MCHNKEVRNSSIMCHLVRRVYLACQRNVYVQRGEILCSSKPFIS